MDAAPMIDRPTGLPRLAALLSFAALAAAVLAMAVLASSADAYPQGHLACFGTALHVDGAEDPVIANPYAVPCAASSRSQAATGTIKGSPGSGAEISPAASTSSTLHEEPVEGDNGTAKASAEKVAIISGETVIDAHLATAEAAVTCTSGGGYQLSGKASVAKLEINGVEVAVTGGEQSIPTAAGLLRIDAAYTPAPFARYERALWLHTPSGDIIAGEAAVASIEKPCENGEPPPPPKPEPSPSSVPQFGCLASAIQVNSVSPLVANPTVYPCLDADVWGAEGNADSKVVDVTNLYARTTTNPDPLPTYTSLTPYPSGTTATSQAGAGAVSIGYAGLPVSANSVASTATSTCSNGALVLSSTSQVDGLRINGNPPADVTTPETIPLGNGQGVVRVNYLFQTPSLVVRVPLWVETFTGENVLVGESFAGVETSPC